MQNKKETKLLWFRVGVSFPFTQEEYEIVRRGGQEDATQEEQDSARQILATKMRRCEYILDGETYSPAADNCSAGEWLRDTELNYDFHQEMYPPVIPETNVKVMMVEGCLEDVLKDQDVPIKVELIHDDPDYEDHEQLQAYRQALYYDASYMPCKHSAADFKGEDSPWNTRICYLYRDAGNNKVFNECVVKGTFTAAQAEDILDHLESGEYFIPYKVGLPEVKHTDNGYAYDEEEDLDWFELTREGFVQTEDAPTVDITAQELVARFRNFGRGCWHPDVPF